MPSRPKTKATSKSLRVLFVGNSFTARNDLPGLVAGLALAAGNRFEHRLLSAGGASLRRHWNAGEAAEAIRTGGYDYVVLQEQSTLPLKNPQRMHESVRMFDGVTRAAGAKTALYMTWARRDAPPYAQDRIAAAYDAIGRELGALVVPVGRAWQSFVKEYGAAILYDRDGSHPSAAGSYLAACVFFASLYDASPVGIGAAPAGLTEEQANMLERSAGQVGTRPTRGIV